MRTVFTEAQSELASVSLAGHRIDVQLNNANINIYMPRLKLMELLGELSLPKPVKSKESVEIMRDLFGLVRDRGAF